MGFEDVSPEMEWEARRMAAACGLNSWEGYRRSGGLLLCDYGGMCGEIPVGWGLCLSPSSLGELIYIEVGKYSTACRLFDGEDCMVEHEGKSWTLHNSHNLAYNELMTKVLYCLGFNEEQVVVELNHPLTAHERLELRLSMPREFWPKMWLDEENAAST